MGGVTKQPDPPVTEKEKMTVLKKLTSFTLALMLVLTVVMPTVCASASAAMEEPGKVEPKPGTYYAYLEELGVDSTVSPKANIEIDATVYAESSGLSIDTVLEKSGTVLQSTGDKLTVSFTVDETGFYNIAMEYCALPANGSDIEFTVEIDGKTPFDGLKKLTVPRVFAIAEGDFPKDNRGNELRPDQTEEQMWREVTLEDAEGILEDPYAFYLTAGEHTVSFTLQREKAAVASVRIFNDEALPSYTAPSELTETDAEPIVIEAEHAKYTTSSMLYPISTMNEPNTTPSDPALVRLNTIGGENWVYPSQSLVWEFEVDTAGYYSVGFRYLQNVNNGMDSHRRIKIDGEYLYEEMTSRAFGYSSSWKKLTLGGEEPYYFYLSEGTHTIEMSVTTGDMAELISEVDDAVYALNTVYRKIIMITGTSPDIYRDYYLDEMIPGLLDQFAAISSVLKRCEAEFTEKTGVAGGETATLTQIYYQLDDFVESPYSIPSRLSTFETNISSLATWVMDNREQPLELDKIYVTAYGKDQPADQYNFLESVWFQIRSFFLSFVTDYSSVGNVYESEEVITVWINSGRDQAEVVKSMIDSDFTKNTGIPVNFAISSALMQAVMAGKGPDVSINVSRGQPVNLALREAVLPISQFDDFGEIAATYNDTDLIPYYFDGDCYALPETKTFYMMFYRTDVFAELGITPPDTWDDFYNVAEVLQRNNMNIGIPYSSMSASEAVNSGVGSHSIFPTLLLQNGVRLYADDLRSTNLSGEVGYKTFKMWTEFYTLYGLPVEKNDFNRFRSGEMPLTISKYTFYNQLYVAAPEIRNLWGMVSIPATVNEDGTLDRSQVGAGTACIMLRDTENTANAWEFMKWWTDADTQGTYGRQIESVLGAASRYSPCKAEAVSQIPWSGTELTMLLGQFDSVYELEEIPGGYYSSRNIDNAFKEVVYNNANARETLNYWNDKTDDEILRKRKEFGLD